MICVYGFPSYRPVVVVTPLFLLPHNGFSKLFLATAPPRFPREGRDGDDEARPFRKMTRRTEWFTVTPVCTRIRVRDGSKLKVTLILDKC